MNRIVYLPSADDDLNEIFDIVAQDDPSVAARFINRVRTEILRLADFPLSASPRPELGEGIRSLPVGAYRILHRVKGDHVLIVRVIHAARDIGGLFDADA